MADHSTIKGFRTFDAGERRATVARLAGTAPDGLDSFATGGLTVEDAEIMSENVIGTIGLPVGVATNMTVNGRDVLVPMATEEASVIAAASNGARVAASWAASAPAAALRSCRPRSRWWTRPTRGPRACACSKPARS